MCDLKLTKTSKFTYSTEETLLQHSEANAAKSLENISRKYISTASGGWTINTTLSNNCCFFKKILHSTGKCLYPM